MVLKNRFLPVGTVPFLSNSTQELNIPRNNAIRRITMKFFVEHVSGASDPTEIQDTILKIIKKIRLQLDGDDNKFNVDAQKWFYNEKLVKGTEPATNKDDNQAGSTSTKTWFVELVADFALNVLDLSDISALLPAKKFSQLKLQIEWGAVGDMFSANPGTITVANSGCAVEVFEVIETGDNDSFAQGIKPTFLDVRQQISQHPITGVFANLEENALAVNVQPVPALIRKSLFIVKDSSGLKTDANVTRFAIVDTRGAGETLYRNDFVGYKRMLKGELGIESLDTGVILLDHVELQRGGIQNVFNEGDFKLKFQTAVGSGTIELLTEYIAGSA